MASTAGVKSLLNSGVLYTDRLKQYLNEKRLGEVFADVNVFSRFSKRLKMGTTNSPDFKMFEYNSPYYDPSCTITFKSDCTAPTANTQSSLNGAAVALNTSTPYASLNNMPWTAGIKMNLYTTTDPATAVYIGQAIIFSAAATSSTVKFIHINTAYVTGATALQSVTAYAYVIGHASPEYSLAPDAHSDEMSLIYNSCGITRTSLEITGTLLKAALRGESQELLWERAKKTREHMVKKEKNYILSRRIAGLYNDPTGTTNGHLKDEYGREIRSTHGILPSLVDFHAAYPDYNTIIDINPAAYGWSQFKNDSRKIFKYSNDMAVKYMFCGDEMLSFFNDITSGPMGGLSGRVQITQDMKATELFGFDVNAFKTPFGTIKLVRMPLLTLTENGRYSGYGFIVDPDNVGYVSYRPSKYETNLQENGRDGVKDGFFSDDGIWMGNLMTHKLMRIGAAA